MKDEYIRKQDAVDTFNRAVQNVGILDADDIETVFGMLSSADVVPVVHGEWKPHEDKQVAFGLTFECSCCGSIVLVNDALEFGYCPYCGAKMDGKE